MITNSTIESLLSARLATIPSLPPVLWPDAAADVVSGAPNVLANMNVTKRPFDNVMTRINGTLKLTIRFPVDRGAEAEAVGAAVEAAFPSTGLSIDIGPGMTTDWCCAGGLSASGQWATVIVNLAFTWYGN